MPDRPFYLLIYAFVFNITHIINSFKVCLCLQKDKLIIRTPEMSYFEPLNRKLFKLRLKNEKIIE